MPEISPIPLRELTTLRTGAAPMRMWQATTREDLIDTLVKVWRDGYDWLVLGGGSNLFAGDEEFVGDVVRVCTSGIEQIPGAAPGFVRLRVAAGHSWDSLVAHAVEQGWAGIEALSGIPGTVGAAPVQNIGAYGQEIREVLVEVELLDEATSDPVTASAAELELGFRTSVLKHHYGSVPQRPAVILSVTLDLRVASSIWPGEQLASALGGTAGERTLLEIREQVMQIRGSKGMVLDAADPDTNSAGSFFQNAIVPESFARTLPERCPRWSMASDETPQVFPLDSYQPYLAQSALSPAQQPAMVKVSTAWLIEHSGITRGFHFPDSRAAVSSKHVLALTNRGGATAAEIAELARFIATRVHSEFGLPIHPEPVVLGVEL